MDLGKLSKKVPKFTSEEQAVVAEKPDLFFWKERNPQSFQSKTAQERNGKHD